MAAGTASSVTRLARTVPMLAAVASAMALTGAAFFTVQQAACGDPSAYIRHDSHIELIGGCVDGSDIPGSTPSTKGPSAHGDLGDHSP
jgi:hypothetical protein